MAVNLVEAIMPKNGTQVADTETEEVRNPYSTLANLQLKAGIMSSLISSNKVEQPAIDVVRFLTRKAFYDLVTDEGIEGVEYLQEAVKEAKENDKRLILTPAHVADVDHPTAIFLMAQYSRALGLENNIVWKAGVNMLRRPSTAKFMRSEHVIYNVTPRDMNHLRTLQEGADEFGFGEEEILSLEEIKQIFNDMREKAREKVLETCVRQGKTLAVYIEGGRSYDGYLKSPPAEFAWFFPHRKNDEAIVVPYRVYGSRELNPPGTSFTLLRKELVMPWLRYPVRMKVGQPYPSSEIWEVRRIRKMEIRKNGGLEKVNPQEWPAANIANIDPAFVRPEERGLYLGLLERFAPSRVNSMWYQLS